jgi:GMP synthase (glutamine-hydrolysing)
MNQSALAIRHVAFEDLGVLRAILTARGYSVRYLEAGIDPIDPTVVSTPDLVIILGGPIGVYETDRYPFLAPERTAITARLALDKPTLGLCLGAQLMAQALGAEVKATGRVEIGYSLLELTESGRTSVLADLESTPVLHWHGDQFEIPEGALRLAQTPGFPNQAFAIGKRILGLQFHAENDHTQIERWLIGHAHELAAHGLDPGTLRRDAAEFGPGLTKVATHIFGRWLDELR